MLTACKKRYITWPHSKNYVPKVLKLACRHSVHYSLSLQFTTNEATAHRFVRRDIKTTALGVPHSNSASSRRTQCDLPNAHVEQTHRTVRSTAQVPDDIHARPWHMWFGPRTGVASRSISLRQGSFKKDACSLPCIVLHGTPLGHSLPPSLTTLLHDKHKYGSPLSPSIQ